MARRFRKPSPGLVVAMVALFVALAGSAVAAGVVPLAKRALVADNALKLNGKSAAQIVASVPAPPAVTSVASLVSTASANWSLAAGAEQNFTATCPAGAKAVGGGFSNPTTAAVFSFGSFPTADGTGWTEDLANVSQSTAANGTVTATCLK